MPDGGGGPFFLCLWRGLAIPYGGLNVFWRGKCCGGAWLEDPRQLWRTAGPLRIWTYRLFWRILAPLYRFCNRDAPQGKAVRAVWRSDTAGEISPQNLP